MCCAAVLVVNKTYSGSGYFRLVELLILHILLQAVQTVSGNGEAMITLSCVLKQLPKPGDVIFLSFP